MSKVKTSLSLKKSTLRKVKQIAKRNNRSVSGQVEFWLEDTATTGELRIPAQTEETKVPA